MRFFIDKTCGGNLQDGLEFYAAGIIESDYTKNGAGSSSGKDYAVAFINPWGEVERQWRSVDEIRIIKADESDFELLKIAIYPEEGAV